MMQFSDPQLALNPYTRHNYAYREWQRLSAIKDAESRESQRPTLVEAVEEDDDEN